MKNETRKRMEIVDYTRRRWDVYHLFSTEMASIFIGLALGWTGPIV